MSLAAAMLSGCDGTEGVAATRTESTVSGTLAGYVVDDFEHAGETHFTLRLPSGDERPLVFDTASALGTALPLQVGTAVSVSGSDGPGGLRVTSIGALPANTATSGAAPWAETRRALVAGPPYPPRSFAFVLVDIGGGSPLTADTVLGRLLTNPDSIRNYYVADSYGRQDVTAQVFGPLPFTMTACATVDLVQMATVLRAQIPGTFDHYLWYFGTRTALCSWIGVGALGTASAPQRDTWYNASNNCIVLVQEPGHNFGMQHSSSLICPGASFADDPNTCTASEYGDIYDPMGSGCRHMNAWQKDYQGWFGGCNGVRVTASGTFTLLPFEKACQGAQFLQVRAARPRTFNRPAAGGGGASTETLAFYYIELRTPIDFDGTLGNRTAIAPSLLVHAGSDLHARDQPGVHTYLLDMTPATATRGAFNDAGLPAGATFTDPAGGVSITAVDVSAEQATVTVTIDDPAVTAPEGGAVCLDGSAFAMPGPGPDSCSTSLPGAGGFPGSGGSVGASGGSGGSDAPAAASGGAGGTAPGEKPSLIAPTGCTCALQPSGFAQGGGAQSATMIGVIVSFAGLALMGLRRRRSSGLRRRPRCQSEQSERV